MINWFELGFHDGTLNFARGGDYYRYIFNERINDSPLAMLSSSNQVSCSYAETVGEGGEPGFDVTFSIDGFGADCVVHLVASDVQDVTAYYRGVAIGLLNRAASIVRNHRLASQMHDHLAYDR